MPRQRIAARKLAVALRTDVRPLARVQFAVPLEVVQPAEPHLARVADVGLLLGVREEVRLEVVVPRELRVAVGALVFLVRRGARGEAGHGET